MKLYVLFVDNEDGEKGILGIFKDREILMKCMAKWQQKYNSDYLDYDSYEIYDNEEQFIKDKLEDE